MQRFGKLNELKTLVDLTVLRSKALILLLLIYCLLLLPIFFLYRFLVLLCIICVLSRFAIMLLGKGDLVAFP